MKSENILIIYLNVGGGHKSMANTLAEIEIKKGNKVELLCLNSDGKGNTYGPITESGYNLLTLYLKPVWYLMTTLLYSPVIINLAYYLYLFFYKEKIDQAIKQYTPDTVYHTYYFGGRYCSNNYPHIENTTYITDVFSAPRVWFSNPNNKYTVFSNEALLKAKLYGAKNTNVMPYPYPEKFKKVMTKYEKEIFQASLPNFNNTYPTVLILAGGSNMPGGEKILSSIITSLKNTKLNLIIICGRSKKLYNYTQSLLCDLKSPTINITLTAFTPLVYEYINLADLVITKAGPASILEIAKMGKPLIISSYIWEQEKANVAYVIQNNLGKYITNPDRIVSEIKTLQESKSVI